MNQQETETEDIAARWAGRALSGDMSDSEKAQLHAWLAQHPENRRLYEEFMEISDLAAEASMELASRNLESDLRNYAAERVSRRAWLVAAPAIAASVAAAGFFFLTSMPGATSPQKYATLEGEMKTVTLDDGSTVSLNTNSHISVQYTEGQRLVALESGEAIFDVMRDPDRPFAVSAGGLQAMVLGTRFNVDASQPNTSVSVLSGVVEVTSNIPTTTVDSENGPVTLIAGQQAALENSDGQITVRNFNPDRVTSWQRGFLVFENTPLATVVDNLNRYYAADIGFGSPEIKSIPVSGRFDITDQATTIAALELALSLRAEHELSGNIVLYKDE